VPQAPNTPPELEYRDAGAGDGGCEMLLLWLSASRTPCGFEFEFRGWLAFWAFDFRKQQVSSGREHGILSSTVHEALPKGKKSLGCGSADVGVG